MPPIVTNDTRAAASLAAVMLCALTACPSTPEVRPEPREVDALALTVAPEVVSYDISTRRFLFEETGGDETTRRLAAIERNIWPALVLPMKPASQDDAADIERGLALSDVLTRMLAAKDRDQAFDVATFVLATSVMSGVSGVLTDSTLFADGDERARWLGAPGPVLPSGVVKTDIRWLVGGQLLPAEHEGGPRRVFVWLMDRGDQQLWSGTTDLDLPRVIMPRLLLLRLITDAGLAPLETERGDMLWTEELDDDGLRAVGRGTIAAAWQDDQHLAPINEAVKLAPWSYTAWLLFAHAHSALARTCDAAVRDSLNRALSLNPHADFLASMDALGCQLESLIMSSGAQMYEAMMRSGTTNCAVAGKAIAAVGGGREVPGSGFLAGLGGVYRNTTCKDDADSGLARLAETVRDPFVRAGLLIDAGVGAISSDELVRAQKHFESAIAAIESMPEPRGCLPALSIAEAELDLAGLALQRGQAAQGREAIARAEQIGATCSEPRLVARAENTRGLVEQASGQYAKALAAFESARDTFARLGDEMNLAVTHLNIGWTRTLLGQYDKALPELEAALVGKRRVRSAGGTAVVLENLGVTYMTLSRFDEAEPLFLEAASLTTDPTSRAAILNNLARIRASQGKNSDARALLDEARGLATAAGARTLEGQIEQTDGGIAAELRDERRALDAFNRALVIRREVNDRAGEGLTLSSLMVVAARLGKPGLAIVYGKLAVAAHQEVKEGTKGIDQDAERAFLRSREATYRTLADLLVKASRLIEAERVLALLKIDEVNDWTRSVDVAGRALPLTPAEQKLELEYQRAADKVMATGREYATLSGKWPLTPAESKRVDQLRDELAKANAQFGKFLAALSDRKVESRGIEELRDGTGIGPDLAELPAGTVAVYTLLTGDSYNAIVVSADAQVAATVAIDSGDLNRLVSAFRRALQDPRSDPRPIGKELYDILVAPIVKHLDGAKATNILWSLDRTLRYVPMGALWDGERYLVERWASAVFTPASRARMKDKPLVDWRVLAAGVSKGSEGFAPLPGVKDELAAIVDDAERADDDGALPGTVLLDDAFERGAFLALLGRRWPVVHIASHFAFEPGNKDASFLVLGKGRLSVSELENMPNLFQGVDLLALSACNTATGDSDGAVGREVESFAVLAQRKGARAVLASLWPVADRSTSALMQRFYRLHKGGVTKLEALRMAQRELLGGALAAGADPSRGPRPLSEASVPEADATPAPVADWTHPYYWAPFVLVGNTL